MSENKRKMAELFDIDVDASLATSTEEADNLEEVTSTKTLHRTFEEECNDLQLVMEPAPAPAKKKKSTPSVQPKVEKPVEIPQKTTVVVASENDDDDELGNLGISADQLDEVDRDIEAFEKLTNQSPEKTQEFIDTVLSAPKVVVKSPTVTPENPLGLSGSQLSIYNTIHTNFPQFKLYDGSVSFRDFYVCKLDYLNRVLSRFKLLNFAEMCKEIRQVKTDHFIGDDFLNPDVIAKKMDDAYRWRVRLNSLLADVYEQCFVWERFVEILRAKLWKDHDLRGAHKRDALVFEHLTDVEQYVAEMNGFKELAKNYDSILKAATDSLSRQVTCLQLNEDFGLSRKKNNTNNNQNNKAQYNNLDTIDTGTLIDAKDAKDGIAASKIVYDNEDEISRLGN